MLGCIMRETALLKRIAQGYREALGENLAGLYLHGSLAFGCFHWETGDIDLIAMARDKLSPVEKRRLLSFLLDMRPQCPPKGIEMSVVLFEHCRHFSYPTPYELHFSQAWAETAEKEPLLLMGDEAKTDHDLAAHFVMLRKAGIVLCGPPIEDAFAIVPRRSFVDSIRRDMANAPEDALSNPVYVTLNLCRTLAFLTEGLLLSKEEGGRWMISHTSFEWQRLIYAVLECYRTGEAYALQPDMARDFALLMRDRMKTLF